MGLGLGLGFFASSCASRGLFPLNCTSGSCCTKIGELPSPPVCHPHARNPKDLGSEGIGLFEEKKSLSKENKHIFPPVEG